jgi:hypothetical protein
VKPVLRWLNVLISRHIAATLPVGLATGPIPIEPSLKALSDAQCMASRATEQRARVDAVAARLAEVNKDEFAQMIEASMRGNG